MICRLIIYVTLSQKSSMNATASVSYTHLDVYKRQEYDETPDQLRCCEEIKHDMMRSSPMDRLLCGDVGFGKTEVALLSLIHI